MAEDTSDPRVTKARRALDSDVPYITAENWSALNESGWRFEDSHTPRNLNGIVEFYQNQFGKENVALGWRFGKHPPVPVEDSVLTGVYIRDSAAQINAVHDLLEDNDVVAGVVKKWTQCYDEKRKKRR